MRGECSCLTPIDHTHIAQVKVSVDQERLNHLRAVFIMALARVFG